MVTILLPTQFTQPFVFKNLKSIWFFCPHHTSFKHNTLDAIGLSGGLLLTWNEDVLEFIDAEIILI